MDRPWLRSYPEGVSADIEASRYSSLVALLEESFAKYRDRDSYVSMGRRMTYGELDALSQALAGYFQSLGLERGTRIALMMPNVLQYPVAAAAVLRAGYIAVNVNPMYTPRELEHQLKDSGAVAIVILENFAATLAQAIGHTGVKHVVVASVGDLLGFPKGLITNFVVRHRKKAVPPYSLPGSVPFNTAIARGRRAGFRRVEIGPDDVAVLQYTGGTTGVAKGAVLLHRTLVGALLSSDGWIQPGLKRKPIGDRITIVCALPLYHVFAFVTCSLLGMRVGGTNLLIANPRDVGGMIAELAKHRMNVFPAVNTLFNSLANHPEFAKLDFSGLVISNGGGTAVQEAVAKKWLAITGCPIAEGYGLSETSSGVTCNRTDTDAYTGTVGLPLPGVHVRLLDDDGRDVPQGEPGEIAIRGAQVMAGYWQRPEDTAQVMTPDGYFKSGDVGIMDEKGYIRIVDRKKDMILVSGFNVYPNEVEGVVAMHPGVLECAVVGIPDEHCGEAVVLYVVRKDPALDERTLAKFCAEQLTGYKKPRQIRFRDDLPKTNVGKILRRELRSLALKEIAKKDAAPA
ncbi:MAG TPA: long-chain-fatty-acid--CoA ligase [Xanthomonadales bacterium]|nr:long-chain-fatty-acid--CoA ligase [Xanthomonadales bacterium]